MVGRNLATAHAHGARRVATSVPWGGLPWGIYILSTFLQLCCVLSSCMLHTRISFSRLLIGDSRTKYSKAVWIVQCMKVHVQARAVVSCKLHNPRRPRCQWMALTATCRSLSCGMTWRRAAQMPVFEGPALLVGAMRDVWFGSPARIASSPELRAAALRHALIPLPSCVLAATRRLRRWRWRRR